MSFLEQVLADKKSELAAKRMARAESDLTRSDPSVRDFRRAISGGGRIIAEIKRRSPRVEAFRQQGTPEELATLYSRHGAAAISIVTDTARFGSSLEDVESVRSACTLPVLVKDFIVDSYQVTEAWASGADAVLLIARILGEGELTSLLEHTRQLGLAALVECHDAADVAKAYTAEAEIMGINNRDLDSLEVSLQTTRQLVPTIPTGVTKVCESGISRREDIESLLDLDLDAFLIGGALLDSEDPGRKLRELRGLAQARESIPDNEGESGP